VQGAIFFHLYESFVIGLACVGHGVHTNYLVCLLVNNILIEA
jgi:hypothetical protein